MQRTADHVSPRPAATVPSMGERNEMVMVPLIETSRSADDIVAEYRRNGWQLLSKRIESDGVEVGLFRRPV